MTGAARAVRPALRPRSAGARAAPLWALATLVLGCTGEPGPGSQIAAATLGARLFADRALSAAPSNAFACATCHGTAEVEPSPRGAGGTLHGVARRPSFWGGQVTSLLDATNVCLTSFMGASAPLARDTAESKSLYEFLAALGPESARAARPFTVVRDVPEVERRDPGRGAEVWAAACRRCHGELHTGAGRLEARAVVLPEHASTYAASFPRATAARVVVEKVRHGRFFGIGGVMPPFSTEALSDEDLGALLAALGL